MEQDTLKMKHRLCTERKIWWEDNDQLGHGKDPEEMSTGRDLQARLLSDRCHDASEPSGLDDRNLGRLGEGNNILRMERAGTVIPKERQRLGPTGGTASLTVCPARILTDPMIHIVRILRPERMRTDRLASILRAARDGDDMLKEAAQL
jgi:hypothetical protein